MSTEHYLGNSLVCMILSPSQAYYFYILGHTLAKYFHMNFIWEDTCISRFHAMALWTPFKGNVHANFKWFFKWIKMIEITWIQFGFYVKFMWRLLLTWRYFACVHVGTEWSSNTTYIWMDRVVTVTCIVLVPSVAYMFCLLSTDHFINTESGKQFRNTHTTGICVLQISGHV